MTKRGLNKTRPTIAAATSNARLNARLKGLSGDCKIRMKPLPRGSDFTFVDDIVRGTILGLKPLGFEVINLGSGQPIALIEVIHLIESLAGKPGRLEYVASHPADVPATWADLTRARTLLGWEPETAREEGFAELIRWYRENRDWTSEIETT